MTWARPTDHWVAVGRQATSRRRCCSADPATYVTAVALVITVSAVAIAGPARRAVRNDPARALNRGAT